MLKVLMMGPLGPPHVENQALALKERGVDVHVGGSAPPDLADMVLEDAGISVNPAPVASRSTPWGMASTVRWARRLIADTEPDLVHAHWPPGFGLAAALAGASPLALTAWGSDVYRADRMMNLANRVAFRRAQLVMADSQDLLDRCFDLGARRDRAAVVQWGVDLSTFTPADDRAALKRELGLGPGPLLLSPRSFMPVYNIPLIIEAFGLIGSRLPEAQLVLKHMGAVRIELPELPHPDRVRVVGSVPYEEMANYYRAADVCLSITSSDSSPRTVWEAMASGCPCVVSDLPWVRERIEPGVHALAVPIAANAVAEAALSVLADASLAARLARQGRELVRSSLSREREMDRLVALYEGLLA